MGGTQSNPTVATTTSKSSTTTDHNRQPSTSSLRKKKFIRQASYREVEHLNLVHHSLSLVPFFSPLYRVVNRYLVETHCRNDHKFGMTLSKIYKFDKNHPKSLQGSDYTPSTNRVLLWHGTQGESVLTIIQRGFEIPLDSVVRDKNLMFGRGIYFADRSSKSSQYCDTRQPGKKGYLFLCSVDLGRVYKTKEAHNNFKKPPPGYDSVQGLGFYQPDIRNSLTYNDSTVPINIANPCDREELVNFKLKFNEYVVYNPKRIQYEFLVEVLFHSNTLLHDILIGRLLLTELHNSMSINKR